MARGRLITAAIYKGYQIMSKELTIIGAGASGMIAAIQAAEYAAELHLKLHITLLEKLPRPGKKLLATGNGRCNIANAGAAREHYYNAAGQNPAFVQPALQKFTQIHNMAFFRNMGLLTKEEENGKLYPMGDQAVAVLDCLRLRIDRPDAALSLLAPAEVQELRPRRQGGFALQLVGEQAERQADAVILALGGLASPQLSNSQGFARLLQPLGLKATRLYPALTQVKIASPLPKALQGIKFNGRVRLCQPDGACLGEAEGEVLFAAYGLSGPPILQLSRLVSHNFYEQAQPRPQTMELDLLPAMSAGELLAELQERRRLPLLLEDFLTGILNKRLGQQLIKLLDGRSLAMPAASLSDTDLQRLARLIKALPLPVSGVTGWERAQVMAGGLALKDFDSQTLAARRWPGLFAAGELLDICGDCGGYNLSWAWSSGRLAAKSAVEYLLNS